MDCDDGGLGREGSHLYYPIYVRGMEEACRAGMKISEAAGNRSVKDAPEGDLRN